MPNQPRSTVPSVQATSDPTVGQGPSLWATSVQQLKRLYYQIKNLFYTLRYDNVQIATGVRVRGKLSLDRQSSLTLQSGVFVEGVLALAGGVRMTVGPHSCFTQQVNVYGKGEVAVGTHTLLNGTQINCFRTIAIGDWCLLSSCYLVDTDYHNLEPQLRRAAPGPKAAAPITIADNVWIGHQATVMKGVKIGINSVVGLGAIVRKPVPPNVVVIGNPQKIVRYLSPPG